MKTKTLKRLMITALVMIFFGILFAFIHLDSIYIKTNNDGYVSAIFSLSGILLYFTALMYQIKEYKLQVVELRKSVEAQTKSSEALDEQKRILLEQNTNNLIFGFIESFNTFKARNNTDEILNRVVIEFQNQVYNYLPNTLQINNSENSDFNSFVAISIKERFSSFISTYNHYLLVNKYVQFVFNILALIDANKVNMSKDNFTPFFFSQLNSNEIIIIYLSNLLEIPIMPSCENLRWDYYITKDIVDKLKGKSSILTDKRINIEKLTKCFNEIRQK